METLAYKINEVVEVTGVSRSTLYEAIARGELRAIKLGRRTLIRVEDLKSYMAGLPAMVGSTLP